MKINITWRMHQKPSRRYAPAMAQVMRVVKPEDIDKIYLAGGFGYYIAVKKIPKATKTIELSGDPDFQNHYIEAVPKEPPLRVPSVIFAGSFSTLPTGRLTAGRPIFTVAPSRSGSAENTPTSAPCPWCSSPRPS